MFARKTYRNHNRKQYGIGLPAAIFVITLMSVIAAAIAQLVSQNAQTYSEELNLSRAFNAAESGAGFAMNTIFPPEDYPDYANANKCPALATVYDFVDKGLTACSAVVSCTLVTIDGDSYATIVSKGECGDIERTVQVRTVY